ncbi:hypothetical protein [Niallia endozanthoxylica]|nr:hypothetical protein [Niallia endozanthoxylica]
MSDIFDYNNEGIDFSTLDDKPDITDVSEELEEDLEDVFDCCHNRFH